MGLFGFVQPRCSHTYNHRRTLNKDGGLRVRQVRVREGVTRGPRAEKKKHLVQPKRGLSPGVPFEQFNVPRQTLVLDLRVVVP